MSLESLFKSRSLHGHGQCHGRLSSPESPTSGRALGGSRCEWPATAGRPDWPRLVLWHLLVPSRRRSPPASPPLTSPANPTLTKINLTRPLLQCLLSNIAPLRPLVDRSRDGAALLAAGATRAPWAPKHRQHTERSFWRANLKLTGHIQSERALGELREGERPLVVPLLLRPRARLRPRLLLLPLLFSLASRKSRRPLLTPPSRVWPAAL